LAVKVRKVVSIQDVSVDIRSIVTLHPGLIKKVGIFGSLARGDFNDSSDIDLLVEYNSPTVFSMDSFERYCSVCNQIQDTLKGLYNRSVDIAHFENGSLDNMGDPDVEKDVIWI
jgi:predicted nucleotidyltransferase